MRDQYSGEDLLGDALRRSSRAVAHASVPLPDGGGLLRQAVTSRRIFWIVSCLMTVLLVGTWIHLSAAPSPEPSTVSAPAASGAPEDTTPSTSPDSDPPPSPGTKSAPAVPQETPPSAPPPPPSTPRSSTPPPEAGLPPWNPVLSGELGDFRFLSEEDPPPDYEVSTSGTWALDPCVPTSWPTDQDRLYTREVFVPEEEFFVRHRVATFVSESAAEAAITGFAQAVTACGGPRPFRGEDSIRWVVGASPSVGASSVYVSSELTSAAEPDALATGCDVVGVRSSTTVLLSSRCGPLGPLSRRAPEDTLLPLVQEELRHLEEVLSS